PRGGHRGALPRRAERRPRSEGKARGDRGPPHQVALTVSLRRDVLDRGDHRPAEHPPAPLRVRRPGGPAAPTGPRGAPHAAVAEARGASTIAPGDWRGYDVPVSAAR